MQKIMKFTFGFRRVRSKKLAPIREIFFQHRRHPNNQGRMITHCCTYILYTFLWLRLRDATEFG